LLKIVAHLEGNATFALAGSCRNLYNRLQPTILKFNIQYQNSNLLHLAARDNNIALAETLLHYNANVNAFFRGKSPLMRALKYSSVSVFKLLLQCPKLDINIQNQAQKSALWYAVIYGTCQTVLRVLECPNLRVDLRHGRGRTALHLAVWVGRIGIVQLLLSHGSDPCAKDDFGHSPWAWACHANRSSMKRIFSNEYDFEPSFDPHSIDRDELPLHQAVSHGSPDAVKWLLKTKDLDLEAHDRCGYTPLHLAVWSQRLEVVDLLLKHPRTSVNCKDQDGNTPLWLSTYMSCDEITERLLDERSIDINFIGGRGRYQTPSTSLHHAVARLDTVVLRRLLAMPGIDPNLCAAGQSPFSVAVAHGYVKTMMMLLNEGDVEINGRGLADPPICRAAEEGHREAVKLLVQQGERLNINFGTRVAQDTALCIAARDGDAEMVRALLCHDEIDPNLENRWFQAPLSLAAKAGHLLVVDALMTDRRLTPCSLMTSISYAKDDCIRRAIQSKIDDFNSGHGLRLAGSARRRVGAFFRSHE